MALRLERQFDARPGEAVDVAPGVRRVTAANPGPFTFTGTNTFIVGETDVAVIDPGPDDPAHVDALLRALAGVRVGSILVTHGHGDHVGAVAALRARTGAPVHAAPGRAGAAPADWRADALLGHGTLVEGPGYRLEAIATPGHAADHVAFALSGTDLLFSGDHVMGWSTTVVSPPGGRMRDYMESLERLLARPESFYLPAHGGPIREAHAHVRALRTHRRMRERAILAALEAGDATIPQMVERNYAGLEPRLRQAAALSTLAHLEDLAARGIVACDGLPALGGRYWLAEGSTGAGGGAAGAARPG